MKTMNLFKTLLIAVITCFATTNLSARSTENQLIYNTEEVNGVKVSETVYKMDGKTLTQFMKYNYKYDANQQMTENLSQKWDASANTWVNNLKICYTYDNKGMTTEYYKWNAKKSTFILVPEMTVTMDK